MSFFLSIPSFHQTVSWKRTYQRVNLSTAHILPSRSPDFYQRNLLGAKHSALGGAGPSPLSSSITSRFCHVSLFSHASESAYGGILLELPLFQRQN